MKKSTTTISNNAILVLSCDKYADLWEPFFTQFFKFWPHCPYKIYLGSNTKQYHDKRVTTVLSDSNLDWSSDLDSILGQIPEAYVFLWLEDIFPTNLINEEKFSKCFQFLKNYKANHIHIAPVIKPDGPSNDPLFGYYEKGAPYRVTVPGFWNKNALQSLLILGENPWMFEIMGSYRSSYSDGYFCLTEPLFEFIRVVDKGKISYKAFEYCKKYNIDLDINHRAVFSFSERIMSNIQGLLFNMTLSVPWKIRVKFLDTARRLAISY